VKVRHHKHPGDPSIGPDAIHRGEADSTSTMRSPGAANCTRRREPAIRSLNRIVSQMC
jgi:hypothetical protein